MNLFKRTNINKAWINISELDPNIKRQWNDIAIANGISKCIKRLIPSTNQKESHAKKNCPLIKTAREIIASTESYLDKSYVYFLTDENAEILTIIGPDSIINDLNQVFNIKPGISLSMKCAGINAISVAKETKKTTVVQGDEHHLDILSNWSCVCTPLQLENKIIGYLDLSFSVNKDISFAVPLIKNIAVRIEHSLIKNCWEYRKIFIYSQLDLYKLTKREKEICFLWINNYSVNQISSSLFIAKGTVQQVIKRIYQKTNVNSHGKLISKFS